MNNDFYEDNRKYIASIMDLSNPDAKWFTVGINGDVRNYPTKSDVTLSGAQIKLLLNCAYEQAKTEIVDGLNKIVGYEVTPRFAVNLKGYGDVPASTVPILGKNIIQEKKEETPIIIDDIKDELPEVEQESKEDRKAQLEAATRQELISYCKGNNISFFATDSKTTLVGKILRAEGK